MMRDRTMAARTTDPGPDATFDGAAYLRRIGYAGETAATRATLGGIVMAHLRAVPFENLDIVPLGRPLRLDRTGLFAKIVGERRGGYCYEVNGLLAWLLEDLGFTVTRVACQFTEEDGYSDPIDHLALLVDIPDGSRWLVDVGSGRTSPAFPLEVPGPDAWGAPSPPDPADGHRVRVERGAGDPNVGYIWQQEAGAEWREALRFTFTPRALTDFLARSRYFETDPGNHFRQGPICTRLTDAGRTSIRPGMLTVTAHGERMETPLPDDAALHAALRDHFAIDLSAYAQPRKDVP